MTDAYMMTDWCYRMTEGCYGMTEVLHSDLWLLKGAMG